MTSSLRFDFPQLPQSVNKLYIVKGGRKILSTQGRKFKNEFLLARGGADLNQFLDFRADPLSTYLLHLWFLLPVEKLYNFTYGSDKRVKSPFADIDTSNMVKLAEDCVAALLGIRDRNNFSLLIHKREARDGQEKMTAILEKLNLEQDPYAYPER